jgi:hypothetical protein
MAHPSLGIVTAEALATGLIITIIGIISYYLYVATAGGPGRSGAEAPNGGSERFWGMSASLFVVGSLFALFAEYSGMGRRFCALNYGHPALGTCAAAPPPTR